MCAKIVKKEIALNLQPLDSLASKLKVFLCVPPGDA